MPDSNGKNFRQAKGYTRARTVHTEKHGDTTRTIREHRRTTPQGEHRSISTTHKSPQATHTETIESFNPSAESQTGQTANRRNSASGARRAGRAATGGSLRFPSAISSRSPRGGFRAPTGYQHILMGEMVLAFGIIGIRAIADYVPAADAKDPGTENPAKGSSPIVMIVSTLMAYFVLSFLATRGGWAAKASAAFGLLMIVGLMINSEAELGQVATWMQNIGGNGANQPAVSGGSQNLPSNSGTSGSAASNAFGAFERAVDDHSWNAAHDALQALKATGDLGTAGYDALSTLLGKAQSGSASSALALSNAISQFDNSSTGISTRIADLGKAAADAVSTIFGDIF